MDGTDSVDEALDPRIQIELENLNDATDDINKLETELDEAHAAFRQLLSETTKRLQGTLNKVGSSCVEKARCYYDALDIARQAQIKCQQQAQLFQRASEIHAAAKETVALAESRFISHQHEWNFDQAWQDMLNHATLKVMDAENQKTECGREHYRRAVLLHDAEKRLLQLEEKHRRAIIKARPYFEVKAQCDQMLATQKERVECLQNAIQDAKTNYANSLRRLEEISNQIHQQRRDYDFIANGPREPGVGAELVSPHKNPSSDKELSELNGKKIKDIVDNQLNKYDKIEESDSTCNVQNDSEHLGKRSVDGSEATSSQWELELEATIESLNNLAHESSTIVCGSKRENMPDLCFYKESKEESAVPNNSSVMSSSYNFPQSRDCCMETTKESNESVINCQIRKNSFINTPLVIRFEESSASKNDITDTIVLNKLKVNLKDNTSKSISSTPVKTNVINLGSRITQKEIRRTIAKYVPNSVFNFDFNNRKSQSSSDINSFSNFDISHIEKRQSMDDIVDNKTENIELDEQVINLKSNTRSFTMKETYDNGLKIHRAQLSNAIRTNLKSNSDVISEKKWFSLPSSASTSPVKVKDFVSLSNKKTLNKKLIAACDQRNDNNELPLLSLFENSGLLAGSKSKSFSMINLSDKRNFVLLDNLHTISIKTASIGRLEYLKDNSFLRTTR